MDEEPEARARASLLRSLAIYGALLAADVVVIAWVVSAGVQGAGFVTLSIVGVVGLLLGYQVWQHYRDTRAPLAETDGVVQRKWSRADLVIAWDSYYLTVDRTVFRLPKAEWITVNEGAYVTVVHFPHTLNVVSVHEIMRPPPDPSTQI